MRLLRLAAAVAAVTVVVAAAPAEAQTRTPGVVPADQAAGLEAFSAQTTRRSTTTRQAQPARRAAPRRTARAGSGQRTRITVRRARSFLDPGTEVLPLSQAYTDYIYPPLYSPTRSWDTTGAYTSPLPGGTPWTGWLP